MTPHPLLPCAAALAAAWLAWAGLVYWLSRSGPRRGDPLAGLAYRALQVYARVFHRVRVIGREHIPADASPLIVVANHTAGVDPLLIQAVLPFEVRWMMAKDMMLPRFAPLWSWVGVIGVSRVGGDSSAARQALRHLAAGGVLGMFPEGGIARPRRQVLPFEPGVGLIIGKSRAPVLQAVIDGTPYTHSAWGSLLRPSKTRIEFLPLMPYDAGGLKPAEIALDLRSRLLQATGWPENLEPRKDVIRR